MTHDPEYFNEELRRLAEEALPEYPHLAAALASVRAGLLLGDDLVSLGLILRMYCEAMLYRGAR